MDWIFELIIKYLPGIAECIGLKEPNFEVPQPDVPSLSRQTLINAAASVTDYGQLDNEILDSDFLLKLAYPGVTHFKDLNQDIPIDQVEALAQRLYFKPRTTWRNAINGLHCRDWDPVSAKIWNEFQNGFFSPGTVIPHAHGAPYLYLIGNVAIITMANHRMSAARVWLASKKAPFFRQIYTGIYQLHPEIKQLFSTFIKQNCTVQYYLVPRILEQTDMLNSNGTFDFKLNKAREKRVNRSHKFLKCYDVEYILKVEQTDGTVTYMFRTTNGTPAGGALFSNNLINFFHNLLLMQILKRLPFTNFPGSLMNRLIREPFVASVRVIANTTNTAQTPVSHPNGLQGNHFGLMPDIETAQGKLQGGPIFLPRGDSSFGLERIVQGSGNRLTKSNTTCIHNEVINHVAELISPGCEIYQTKLATIFTIINPNLGAALISYQLHETVPCYAVIQISKINTTKRKSLGRLKPAI